MNLYDQIVLLQKKEIEFVVCTVVRITGSSPRKPGSQMIVQLNGSIHGSVGGGALEKNVISDAQKLFSEKGTCLKKYDLTRELGMCCGGIVEVFFQRVRNPEELFIFGAGHVAQPLAAMASLIPFRVTVIDDRKEFLTQERFPSVNRRLISAYEDLKEKLDFRSTTSIVVCTYDHKLDQRVVEFCLRKPFRYLGLIGSVVKATKTRARLKAAGFSSEEMQRVHSPMGIPIGGNSPAEIALSVLAEIVAVRYRAFQAFAHERLAS